MALLLLLDPEPPRDSITSQTARPISAASAMTAVGPTPRLRRTPADVDGERAPASRPVARLASGTAWSCSVTAAQVYRRTKAPTLCGRFELATPSGRIALNSACDEP